MTHLWIWLPFGLCLVVQLAVLIANRRTLRSAKQALAHAAQHQEQAARLRQECFDHVEKAKVLLAQNQEVLARLQSLALHLINRTPLEPPV